MSRVVVRRLKLYTGTEEFCIRGEYVAAGGNDVELGAGETNGRAWWDVPLPPCPDCGGDLVWYEAGYVPGTRKCAGKPDSKGRYDVMGGCGSLFAVGGEE